MNFELAVRADLAIPDAVAVPPACLQTRREWWILRAAHDSISTWNADSHFHQATIAQLQEAAETLRRRLAAEPNRLKKLTEREEREVDFESHNLEKQQARQLPYSLRAEAVAELLK